MRLTGEEETILRGARGDTVAEALRGQIEVGDFFGAERFVPVGNVHMMGDIEVMGEGGLANIIKAHRYNPILRPTGECVRIALTGRIQGP